MKHKKFDLTPYAALSWLEGFLRPIFVSKGHMWDIRRKGEQADRLSTMAAGIKKFLDMLPAGAEVGSTDLGAHLCPNLWEEVGFPHWFFNRMERLRFSKLLDGYFRKQQVQYKTHVATYIKYHRKENTNA